MYVVWCMGCPFFSSPNLIQLLLFVIVFAHTAPNCDQLQSYQENLPHGMIFYSWGDGYSGLHGKVWSCNKKPIVSGKWSLWGNSSDVTSDMVGVEAMIEKLRQVAQLNDPTSLDSYSFIPVHAWSHSYADVLAVVNALASDQFEIVLPSEMLRRIETLVQKGVVDLD